MMEDALSDFCSGGNCVMPIVHVPLPIMFRVTNKKMAKESTECVICLPKLRVTNKKSRASNVKQLFSL